MSYIWEKSSTWRSIVRGTRGNPLAMSLFTAVTMFAVPIGLGTLVMNRTNPGMDDAKVAKLRAEAGLDTKIMQDVNKRRLGILLDEVQRGDKKDDQTRWKAALDGRTSGTTSGSSKGVRM